MAIELEKENKDLDKYIEYVKAQVNYTSEELKADLLQRGLSEDETAYVMTFYKPHVKQRMFSNPFSFHGRIGRQEFGLSMVVYFFWMFINGALQSLANDLLSILVLFALYVVCFWFYFAQQCKRFHDRNLTGWYVLLYFIPFYNIYLFAMQLFADGDEYENDYGPDPKGRNMFA